MPTTSTTPEPQSKAAKSVRARRSVAPALPSRQATLDALADVALVDAKQSATAACISLTTWYDLVRAGEAPAPAIRGHRCTRWRLADVRAWLVKYANRTEELAADVGSDSSTHPVVQRARQARASGLAKAAKVGA